MRPAIGRRRPSAKRSNCGGVARRVEIVAALAVLIGLGFLIPGAAVLARAASARQPQERLGAIQASTTRRLVLGHSVDGRPIIAWLIAPSRVWCSMLVVGSIAGDEAGGIAVTRFLVSQAPLAGVRLWLIPDVNPDGAVEETRVNARGVDLNRNFSFRWRHQGVPGSRYYSGRRPASEPETRAIEAFIRRTRPGLAIWLHQPYGLIDESQGPRWAEQRLARALKLPLERLPDYPGSGIGWDDHVIPRSAFDVELPGGGLSRPEIRRVAIAIRSLAQRFANGRAAD